MVRKRRCSGSGSPTSDGDLAHRSPCAAVGDDLFDRGAKPTGGPCLIGATEPATSGTQSPLASRGRMALSSAGPDRGEAQQHPDDGGLSPEAVPIRSASDRPRDSDGLSRSPAFTTSAKAV